MILLGITFVNSEKKKKKTCCDPSFEPSHGGSVVDNMLDYQSRVRKFHPQLLQMRL